MDRNINKILKFIILVLVSVALVFVFGHYLRKTSPIFNFFFSPDDLYKPLAVSDINVNEKGQDVSIVFYNIYPGHHSIDMLVDHPTAIGQNYDMDLSINIIISEAGINKINKSVSGPFSTFWGGKDNSGISLLRYRTPYDLPLDTMLKATVTIEKPDLEFEERYGKTRLSIQKRSDE